MPVSKDDLIQLLEQQVLARRQNRMASWQPYERQAEFLRLGATKRERLLSGGNRTGKSETGCFEMTCHLSGLYPKWWEGKRFNHPIVAWAGGVSGEVVRNVIQLKLCGTPGSDEAFGTGFIPKALLLSKSAGHGVANLLDGITVRHVSGGVSTLNFKTFEQGSAKWQGAECDVIHMDEEAPEDVYSEALNRLTPEGIIYTTFTPLLGWSKVVSRFLRDDSPEARRDRATIRLPLSGALHFTPEQIAARIAAMPLHERDARSEGIPLLGSGSVWEGLLESDISTSMTLSDIPKHWPLIYGIDPGIGHPFAAALLSWDRDTDTIYLLHTVKVAGQTPLFHAAEMKRVAPGVPVAWPHDAGSREKGSGKPLADLYKEQGLKMLPSHSTFPDGSYQTEGGVAHMLARMKDGRFKASSHLREFFDEWRMYHRKDGLIVKINDDILSAVRCAVMSIRKSAPAQPANNGYYGGVRRERRPTGRDWNVLTGEVRYRYN